MQLLFLFDCFVLVVFLLISNNYLNYCFVNAVFNADEFKHSLYSINILNEPIILQSVIESSSSSNLAGDDDNANSAGVVGTGGGLDHVIVSNIDGQEYYCRIPAVPNSNNLFNEPHRIEEVTLENVTQRLNLLFRGGCLKKTVGWWTYEFCYGRHIQQYHVEGNNVVGNVIYLGFFDHDFNWTSASEDQKQSRSEKEVRYHQQEYSNGTLCDVNSKLRRAEVRFFCEEKVTQPYIYQVDESSSCQYLLVVHTALLCDLHRFEAAAKANEPLELSCQPALKRKQYEQYLEHVKEQERKEKMKMAVLKEMHQELKKAKDVTSFVDENVKMLPEQLKAAKETFAAGDKEVAVMRESLNFNSKLLDDTRQKEIELESRLAESSSSWHEANRHYQALEEFASKKQQEATTADPSSVKPMLPSADQNFVNKVKQQKVELDGIEQELIEIKGKLKKQKQQREELEAKRDKLEVEFLTIRNRHHENQQLIARLESEIEKIGRINDDLKLKRQQNVVDDDELGEDDDDGGKQLAALLNRMLKGGDDAAADGDDDSMIFPSTTPPKTPSTNDYRQELIDLFEDVFKQELKNQRNRRSDKENEKKKLEEKRKSSEVEEASESKEESAKDFLLRLSSVAAGEDKQTTTDAAAAANTDDESSKSSKLQQKIQNDKRSMILDEKGGSDKEKTDDDDDENDEDDNDELGEVDFKKEKKLFYNKVNHFLDFVDAHYDEAVDAVMEELGLSSKNSYSSNAARERDGGGGGDASKSSSSSSTTSTNPSAAASSAVDQVEEEKSSSSSSSASTVDDMQQHVDDGDSSRSVDDRSTEQPKATVKEIGIDELGEDRSRNVAKESNSAKSGIEKAVDDSNNNNVDDDDEKSIVNKMSQLFKEITEEEEKLKQLKSLQEKDGSESSDSSSLSALDDRVKVRISQVKGKTDEKTLKRINVAGNRIEQQLADKLKKAGFDSKGQKVQVKIITTGYYDNENDEFQLLSDEQSSEFSNLIFSILGVGDSEKAKEERKLKEMQENYRFKWNDDANRQ